MSVGTISEPCGDAGERLERLSAKEREVLDHILEHKPLKVIAHDLGITLSAVDQRLKAARVKLGAADRNEAARTYSSLLATCIKSTCGFEAVGDTPEPSVGPVPEPVSRSVFEFKDSATIIVPAPWDGGRQGAVPEVLDEKFGRLWRVAAIPVFAILIAVLALALISMSQSLSTIL